MPTIRFSRPFASGSRPTPDPFDKFLDSHGFYRKHTPRDSSNLFRVISEQLFDTQEHHRQIRKDCVNFLIKHRDQYEEKLQEDFDQYVQKMAKTETFGTLMELRAIGYLLKRNIILYGPFDLGTAFVDEAEYKDPVLRVFHATHFDSVFEKTYIMDAGFCQSVAYEMLYKKVFKLPDIEYSVETMLHSDIIHEPCKHEYENGDEYASHIVFYDGRQFELDRPEHTLCILSDPDRCHFHNKDFDEIMSSKRFEKSILSDKFNSCVRQLLFDGITPFPYKVAKALDENIYRNVEFDSWNEERKASKHKHNQYKVGVECLVKLGESKDDLMKCRIEAKHPDETYVVFVEKLAEKRSVHYTNLRPLNIAQRDYIITRRIGQYSGGMCAIDFDIESRRNVNSCKLPPIKDSNVDYDAICNSIDFQHYINLSDFNFTPNQRPELVAYPMVYAQPSNMNTNNSTNIGNNSSKPVKNRNQNVQNHPNVQSDSNEKQQSTLKVDNENPYGKTGHETKSDAQQTPTPATGYYQHQSQEQNVDANIPAGQQNVQNYYHQGPPPIYYCQTPDYSNEQGVYSSDMVMQPGVYVIPAPYQAPPVQPSMYAPISGNQASHYPVPVGNWPGYGPPMNPPGYVVSGAPHYAVPAVPAPMPFSWPFLSRELLRSNGRINFNSAYAYAPTGEDLPLNDKISVRFYYNLGIEYFKLLNQLHGTGAVMAMIDGDNVTIPYEQPSSGEIEDQPHQMISEYQQFHIEQNEAETQSPSKPRVYNESGYRRNPNSKYKRNDSRSMVGKHFQGTFNGPTNTFKKNNQKYHQSGNISYDSTPMKDNGTKVHQHGHGMSKRDQLNTEADNVTGNIGFGSNVPPFPYYDQNEQHYGPPANAFSRMTPPGTTRPSSVPNAPYHGHSNHQMHGFSQSYWFANIPPGSLQPQSQPHQPQSQSHSLNTSGASNPSQ